MYLKVDLNLEVIMLTGMRGQYYSGETYIISSEDYLASEMIAFCGTQFCCVKTANRFIYMFEGGEMKYREFLHTINANYMKEALSKNYGKFGPMPQLVSAVFIDLVEEESIDDRNLEFIYGVHSLLPYENKRNYVDFVDSIDDAINILESIRPENIEKTKQDARRAEIESVVERYRELFGNDFEKLQLMSDDDACDLIADVFANGPFGYATICVVREKEFFEESVKEKVYTDSLYIRRMQDMYARIVPTMINACREMDIKDLEEDYGRIEEDKEQLLSSLEGMSFEDSLEKYKYYKECDEEIQDKISEGNVPIFAIDIWNSYSEYFKMASILVSNHMNELNHNKAKQRKISQRDLNAALLYFYDASDVEEAKRKKKKIKYQSDKQAGDEGERRVNEALKWLDSEYVVIAQRSKDRYGNPCILIRGEGQPSPQEFDHIVVSTKGVFLIETKNYSGKLVIDKEGNWQREIDETLKGEKNPLMQIRRHEKVVKSFLTSEMPVYSILCIANDSAIIEGTANTELPVIKYDLLIERIEKFEGRTVPQDLVDNTVDLIYKHMIDAEEIGEKLN